MRIPLAVLTIPLLLLLRGPLDAADPAERAGDVVGRIVERIVAGEREFLDRMADYEPFMEVYIQAASEELDRGGVQDQYTLEKVSLDGKVGWRSYSESRGFQRRSRIPFFGGSPKTFFAEGFAQMTVPDLIEFNRETYEFEYLRREFLGEVRALVFDVRPKTKAKGKFVGRVWVEDHAFRIVRFNGSYSGGSPSAGYFHFDSWRINVEDDFWVPAFIYVEDKDKTGQVGERFRAQCRLWDYNRSVSDKLDELTEVLVESEAELRDESGADEVSPLEAQRQWRKQAQENVIGRLERAGLLAPRGEVDDVLNTVVTNLMATNSIHLDIDCRVLLTTPLETFSIGQAIVISRGMIDVLPDEASLAMALANELAHIVLGHRTETMYAFSDWAVFDDVDTLDRVRLRRTPEETREANAKAVEILENSPYKKDLSGAGLFLKALRRRAPLLPNLVESNFGNELAYNDELLRMAELAEIAPELRDESVEQIAALPLGSRVKLDPWTNRISLIQAKPVVLRTARDKIPFEITPFMPRLERRRPPKESREPRISAR